MTIDNNPVHLGRRAFLKHGSLVLTAASLSTSKLPANDEAPRLRVGLVTDLHYADKPSAGTRHYRETLAKLDEAARQFEQDKPSFLVELGDFIDAADSVDTEQSYLRTINRQFSAICKDRHYVLGNHCVDTLKKEEFLGGVEQEKSYYSFDRGGFHFVVLDSCFRGDPPQNKDSFQFSQHHQQRQFETRRHGGRGGIVESSSPLRISRKSFRIVRHFFATKLSVKLSKVNSTLASLPSCSSSGGSIETG